MAQLLWVPRYLRDVKSDMSAVHRVDDVYSMPSARFFEFAWRLPCYRGAMRERVLGEHAEQDHAPRQPRQPAAQPPGAAPPREAQPVTDAVLGDPVMGRIFSFG